ncbi:hypothetical protein SAMN04487974_12023 [Pelagibacterium luteolum]|uniref:Uncharacterized protein n=1 Tax=Pelagibacterium luteolum TaxID=440168 RepID=A0A1G7ZHH0_9HYPH|nr:hypothetical protein SAMN04487974_12023 [Pelagibacterium luteolum]
MTLQGVVQRPDGLFDVVVDGRVVAGAVGTNREAWRAYDRATGDVVSPSEKRADFAFQRSLDVKVKEPVTRRPPMTVAQIEAGRSPKGGWTAKTLRGWGVPWPPPKGWRRKLLKGEPVARNAK